jgi:hypothetical protein
MSHQMQQTNGSQSGFPGPAALLQPGNLLEMHSQAPHLTLWVGNPVRGAQ